MKYLLAILLCSTMFAQQKQYEFVFDTLRVSDKIQLRVDTSRNYWFSKENADKIFIDNKPAKQFYLNEIMSEQDAINKSHIDFTKQYLYFIVHGRVEIDGHTFVNDMCKNPIIFKATIDGVELTDSTNTYTHRKCSHPNCDIIHLEIKTNYLPSPKQWWQGGTTITPLYLK